MKKIVTGMFIGAILGSMVGTLASDEITDFKKMIIKKGKKIIKNI